MCPRSALVSPSTLLSLSALFLLSTPLPRSTLFRLFSLVPRSTVLPRSALFLPAPSPSSATGSLRAVPILTRLRLIHLRIDIVVVSGHRAVARQQPDFDLSRFTAEAQNPGTAGINDGYFYVFELDAEGV